MATYRHSLFPRYGEVDLQGVVYNAHYMVYIDDTMETFLRECHPELRQSEGWDMMLVRCTLEWQGPCRFGERLDIDFVARRWGGSSWTNAYTGTVDGRPVFTAEVVYVSVQLGTANSFPTPAAVRKAFGEAVEVAH